ncbi:flagellin [Propionivibrio sp.]|uniref:flagellin N-terminal helical domain-containing protein n=1 Tax=Propionivibrio sp. TaxID=2212460 RepID=UPI002614FDE0|nr:flagellin [Propionivibrio sp.]
MPQIINTNVPSLNAQRNLNMSQSALATSLQRLSSGLRINSAKDDAAGLSISERMTSQIRGLNQAARNANDGVSLSQTAEGDLAQIGDGLQRMRELAVQSANASNTAADRAAINAEVQSLAAEIDRTAQNSAFNGTKLLDGSFTAQKFQVGANATSSDSITISQIVSARTSALGGVGTSFAATTTSTATTTALSTGDLTLNGFQVGASSLGTGPGQSTASAFSIAAAINSIGDKSGVTATANSNSVTGVATTLNTAIAANTFSINGINIGAIAAGTTSAGQGANIAAAITAVSTQTGVTAVADATTGVLTLTAADGRDVNLALVATATTPANAATAKAAFLTQTGLTADSPAAQVLGTVITAGAFGTPTFAGGSVAAGTLTANGASVGAATLGTGAFTAATAATTAAIGTTLTFSAGMTAGSTYDFTTVGGTAQSFSIVATGVAATDAQAFATAFNAFAGTTTVTGGGAVLTAAGGTFGVGVTSVRTAEQVAAGVTSAQATIAATSAIATANAAQLAVSAGTKGTQASNGAAYGGQELARAITLALASATGGAAVNGNVTSNQTTGAMTYVAGTTDSLQLGRTGTATSAATAVTDQTALATLLGITTARIGTAAAGTNTTNHGTITLSSTAASGIVWAGAAATKAGLAASGTQSATVASAVSSIATLDVLSANSATNALATIDGALATVNASRAALGTFQNRFASVVTSLQTTSENLTASRSRIQDTDFAAETANLTRNSILQQAGTAMLAQANSLPQNVLSLLR